MRKPEPKRKPAAAPGPPEATAQDDAEIVRRCIDHDQEAWRILLARYARLIQSVARKIGLDQDGVEDVFSSVSTTLARRLHLLQDPTCLPKWLIVTTARRARRLSQQRQHTPPLVPILDDTMASDVDIERQVLSAERESIVRTALARLPRRDREVLADLFERELPYTEVARRHGLRVGTLGSLRARALERLRRILDEAKERP